MQKNQYMINYGYRKNQFIFQSLSINLVFSTFQIKTNESSKFSNNPEVMALIVPENILRKCLKREFSNFLSIGSPDKAKVSIFDN